jgi:MHS family proline/betaine transporter-like MFS transporter
MPVSSRTRVVLAAGIGNVVEWYDFGLYGLLAPVLAPRFFPSHDRIAALLGVYGGFAVGFAMRPIGAIVLGRVGDWRGRQFVLVLSVALMGAATVALGLLPSYAAIGIWAPILLILVRLFQGFSVGGEFVGSVTYLVETAANHRRGISGSVANIGATVGMLLAAGAAALTQTLERGNIGLWRAAFLIGGVLSFVAYLLRRHLPPEHTSDLAVNKSSNAVATNPDLGAMLSHRSGDSWLARLGDRWPALQAFHEAPRIMVISLLFTSGYGISNYLIMVFLPTFGREFANVTEARALQINTLGQAIALILVPVTGWASDHLLRRRTIIAFSFLMQAGCAWELFHVVIATGTAGLWIAQLVLAALLAMVMGSAPAMLAEQFTRGYRVSAHAFVLNVGIGIAGGTAPLVAVALIRVTNRSLAPAGYLTFACVVAAVAILLLPDYSRDQTIEDI